MDDPTGPPPPEGRGRGGRKSAIRGGGGKKQAAKRAKPAAKAKSAEDEGAKSDEDEEDNVARIQSLLGALIDAPSNANSNDKGVGSDDDGVDGDDGRKPAAVDNRKPAAVEESGEMELDDYLGALMQGHTKTGGNLEWDFYSSLSHPEGSDQHYKKTEAELANMPTEELLARLTSPDSDMAKIARSEVEKELLALISGNKNPPQIAIVREHGKKEVLRKCTTLQHSLGSKERKAHEEGKMTDEKKDALLEARAKKSVEGAVGGDIQKLTVAAIKKATEAKKAIRHKFDVELVDAGNKAALLAFLALEVADGAEERLAELREEANRLARGGPGARREWLVFEANESGNGPDGDAVMWYESAFLELWEPVSRNGVGAKWTKSKGNKITLSEASNAAGAEDGFLWKGVLWVKKCTTEAEKAAAIEAGAGTLKKPSARYKKLRKGGLK